MAALTTAAHEANAAIQSDQPLPLTTEELTPAWFSKALGKRVKEASIVEEIHGTASKVLVQLAYEGSDSDSDHGRVAVCVKGGFNPAILALHPSLFHVYRLEAEFYHYLASSLNDMRLTPTYFCGTDSASGQGIVILSDLKAEGYTFGEPTEPWSVDRVRLGVEELAVLHAKTWGARSEDFPWFNPAFSLRDVISGLLTEEAWNNRFQSDVRPTVPDHLEDRERIIAAFNTLWNTTDSKLHCIVHGDAHIGNTFITPAGEPGFLDWQGLHAGSAIHDVAYFIVGALSIEDRRKNEEELFQHYLSALHQNGGPRFEKEEAWDEYRKHNLHGFAWALASPMMQPQERVDIMAQRHCAAILDHKSLELLEELQERASS